MSLRDLLVEELKRRGVVVVPEVSFRTVDGRRLMPDLVLRDGAQYVVETKLGAETKLLDAMVQLYDYSKHIGEAKGAFAVLFPEELRRPWPADVIMSIARDGKTQISCIGIFKDLRPSQPFRGSLYEVADWIAGHVLRPLVVEADTGFAIRVLREVVDYIGACVRQLQGRELEDIFGGKSVFENVLQYEEGRYPLEEMRHAAAYLLVNQLLFYHVLTRVDASFPVIDEDRIRRPGDLRAYFEPVLRRNYSSVFGFDVASRLPDSAVDVVRKAVVAVKALAPEKIRHDLLGKVFHELIPFEVRKAVAAFYTNNEAAEILAQLAIDKPDAKVLDLACGSGTLLVAAYRRKRELLLREKGEFTFEDHKRFLEQDLTGIDIMPFAAHMAVVHLALQALAAGHEAEKVRIAVWDSTELEPGQTIPAISRELKAAYKRPTLELFFEGKPPTEEAYVEKGAVTLEGIGGEQIPLEKADVVIMNPPFTRQERLPKEYKDALMKRLKGYEDCLHGQLGLYGYFVLLADKFIKENGRIALVLPSTFLRIRSTKGVRQLLVKSYIIEYIITTWHKAAFSEGAKFREILLIARKGNNKNSDCCIVNVKKIPRTNEEIKSIVNKIEFTSKKKLAVNDDDLALFFVPQTELKREIKNWFVYISAYNPATLHIFRKIMSTAQQRMCTFQFDIDRFDLAHVKKNKTHGFILRYENRLKKADHWYVQRFEKDGVVVKDKISGEELLIPYSALLHGLRSPSKVSTIDVSNESDFIVGDYFEGVNKVCHGISKDTLNKWKSKVQERASNCLIARRFVLLAPGLSLLAFYSDKPLVGADMWCVKGLSGENAKILALWFNSTLNILQIYVLRTLDTWMKIHDYTLKEFLTLDMTKLDEETKKKLLELFNEVSTVKLPSLLQQLKQNHPIRRKIDKTILKILGFNEEEIDELLNELYILLADEIERLKIFMKI
jgi:type I restriction-modification system DNA methylase subunit